VLRGIEHLRGYGAENNRRARELFESAVSSDPRFALAHAYFALALMVEHRYANAPSSIKQTALDAALTATQLDSDDARCHLFLALIYTYRSEFNLALFHYERSISLNPSDANCLACMGFAFGLVGRAEEGIELIR